MRAVRYYGPGDIRLEEVPEPVVKPGQVKVKVLCSVVCGSDLHMYQELVPGLQPTATEPHRLTKETLPVGMGHEISGTVVELGPGVDASKFSVGQHVAIEPLLSCKKPDCLACRSPNTRNLCPDMGVIGIAGCGGGLSEFIAVDQELVHIMPSHVSRKLEIGALIEPLAVVWRAIKKANVKPGDSVLILGAGPVRHRLFRSSMCRVFGASWVGISGRGAKRCELARQHGASAVYDASCTGTDVVAETLKATDGRGADVVVDCAGTQITLDTAIKAARPAGTIMNVSGWTYSPTIDMNVMLVKELTLANSITYSGEHAEVIQAIADGKFDNLESLITRRVALEDFLEKGLGALMNEKDQHGEAWCQSFRIL
ncbi:L-threonine 3-dehydrogenase [Pilatotrama ljubarskyi]|nr:L-threonine 3-dehydrogenase [Pilatotrama ljubarskyi]